MATDLVGQIMAYEAGKMTREEVHEFFQTLIDMKIVSKMQGSHGRMARILIERGDCHSTHAAPQELDRPTEVASMQLAGRTRPRIIAAILLAVLAFVLLAGWRLAD